MAARSGGAGAKEEQVGRKTRCRAPGTRRGAPVNPAFLPFRIRDKLIVSVVSKITLYTNYIQI